MAKELLRSKSKLENGTIVEVVVWQLDFPLPPCTHLYKYRLYYGVAGVCRVRYDNENGKGDHVHYADDEQPYRFSTLEQLLDDFEGDIKRWEGRV